MQKITPCLWFDDQAEEAVNFYLDVFKDSKIIQTMHYSEVGQEIHQKKPGSVMTIEFELNGQRFIALNAGPAFKFSEAVSFQVNCVDQDEIDYYWDRMSAVPEAEQCGWLKDKFGLSWQITPILLTEFTDPIRSQNVMKALFEMKKLDIAKLQEAYDQA